MSVSGELTVHSNARRSALCRDIDNLESSAGVCQGDGLIQTKDVRNKKLQVAFTHARVHMGASFS